MDERIVIVVPPGINKVRLEDFLLDRFPRLSKMYLREIVKAEQCEVNGRSENIGFRLRQNDLVEVVLDASRETAMLPEDIPLEIVFEDRDVVVVSKPAGMLTHPSHKEKTGTLLNALAHYLNGDRGAKAMIRPGLVHRLDKETSGLMIVAKNARAHRILSGQFMKKRVEKRYLALVEGIVGNDAGTIEAPIGRDAELKHWGVREGGKHSVTRFRVRERRSDTTLLELEPVTGRTNQLRIHCELLGHPIVGDVRRGGREFDRLCLHAFRIGFAHPVTSEAISLDQAPSGFPESLLR